MDSLSREMAKLGEKYDTSARRLRWSMVGATIFLAVLFLACHPNAPPLIAMLRSWFS